MPHDQIDETNKAVTPDYAPVFAIGRRPGGFFRALLVAEAMILIVAALFDLRSRSSAQSFAAISLLEIGAAAGYFLAALMALVQFIRFARAWLRTRSVLPDWHVTVLAACAVAFLGFAMTLSFTVYPDASQ